MLTASTMGTPTPVTGIELEDKLNGAPLASRPLFISKPSWVVRTEAKTCLFSQIFRNSRNSHRY